MATLLVSYIPTKVEETKSVIDASTNLYVKWLESEQKQVNLQQRSSKASGKRAVEIQHSPQC